MQAAKRSMETHHRETSALVANKVRDAITALHGLRWAAGMVQVAGDSDSIADADALKCLLNALLPHIGAELEAAHVALGGSPLGYFDDGRNAEARP